MSAVPRVIIESFDFTDPSSDEITDSNEVWSSSDEDDRKDNTNTMVGYDVNAEGEVLRELECPLCSFVLRKPMQLEQCGHCMCENCLNKWKRQSLLSHATFRCPICRAHIKTDRIFENKMIHRMVMDLRVYCPNKKINCSWVGELRDLTVHKERNCEYEMVSCIYEGCHKRCQRRDVGFHEERCIYRIAPCSYCEESVKFKDTKAHLKICSRVPVDCDNGCSKKVLRSEMAGHKANTCSLHVISCPFVGVGCVHQCERKHMQTHLAQKINEHLQQSVQSQEDLRHTIRTQMTLITELKKETYALRKRCYALEQNPAPRRRRSVSISSDTSGSLDIEHVGC